MSNIMSVVKMLQIETNSLSCSLIFLNSLTTQTHRPTTTKEKTLTPTNLKVSENEIHTKKKEEANKYI